MRGKYGGHVIDLAGVSRPSQPLHRALVDQFLPNLNGRVAEYRFGVRRQHVPIAARHLAVKLPRRPSRIAGVHAHGGSGAPLVHRVDENLSAGADVNVVNNVFGAAARSVGAQQDQQLVARHRPADVDGIRALMQAADPGKHGGQLDVRPPVDDDAPRAPVAIVEQQHDGLREIGVPEMLAGDEKPARGQRRLRRGLRHHGGQGQQEKNQARDGHGYG